MISLAAVAALATGVIGMAVAVAKSFTLGVAMNAPVTNTQHVTTHENILVSSKGRALYVLSGNSKKHQKCTSTNSCFKVWPPAKVKSSSSLTKETGITGKLTVWKHDGFKQLVLSGHPLYKFSGDTSPNSASGEGIKSFGGTWSVVTVGSSSTSSGSGSSTTTTTSSTSTSTYTAPR